VVAHTVPIEQAVLGAIEGKQRREGQLRSLMNDAATKALLRRGATEREAWLDAALMGQWGRN
jgi:hypothetical protein